MGRTETGMTSHLRHIALVLILAVGAGVRTVSGMELGGDARDNAAAGDTLSKYRENILFYERSFRPSTYDTPVPARMSEHPTATATPFPGRVTYAAPETVQGFRIQVRNTNSYDESSAVRNALLAAFDRWWVYVLFDSPTYRVRIGDFQSRVEAKRALEQIQLNGFPDAWLVPDKAILHLPPRMPLPQPIDSTRVE